MGKVKSVKLAAIWCVIQTIAAGQLHGASSGAEPVTMMQVASRYTSVNSRQLHKRIPAQAPLVPAPHLSQVEKSPPPVYRVDPILGFCTPWNTEGDLCRPSTPGNHDVACAGVDGYFYLPVDCDMSCARDRCQDDSDCVGFTYRKDGRYKLKSVIEGVTSDTMYVCYHKPGQVQQPPGAPSVGNYLPINFISNAEGNGFCPGSDGEQEFRFDVGVPSNAAFGACAKACNTNADCPSPPTGTTAVCDGFYKKCFLGCNQDSDCQSGATCAYTELCTYQISTTYRTRSPETYYGYPVYQRVTVETPEDACFGNGERAWYLMGGIYVACAPPCEDTSDCPANLAPGRKTAPMCINVGHGYGHGCYIPCSDNRDCQYGAVCLENYSPKRCAFPI